MDETVPPGAPEPSAADAPNGVELEGSDGFAVAAPIPRPGRFAGVLAVLDKPLALGFLTTIGVLGALLLGSALGSISTILVYIVLAMFLAVGLDPIVRRLERHGVKRGGAIAIVFGAFALLFAAFLIWVLPPVLAQIGEFVEAIPETIVGIPETDWFAALDGDTQDAIFWVCTSSATGSRAPRPSPPSAGECSRWGSASSARSRRRSSSSR